MHTGRNVTVLKCIHTYNLLLGLFQYGVIKVDIHVTILLSTMSFLY